MKGTYNYTFMRRLGLTLLAAVWNAGCSDSNDDGVAAPDPQFPVMLDATAPSDPEFIQKARSIQLDEIRLFSGHIDQIDGHTQLDPNSLESGDLITVDVRYESTGIVEQVALELLLLPKPVYARLVPGQTLEQVLSSVSEEEGAVSSEFPDISLGVVRTEVDQDGRLRGIAKIKLPVLSVDTDYKIAALPLITSLSSQNQIATSDALTLPVLIDERVLVVSALAQPHVDFVSDPRASIVEGFVDLEEGAQIDDQGFSVEPILSTSVLVDATSFNGSEEVILTVEWERSDGSAVPMGVLSTDAQDNPVVSTEARFKVSNDGSVSTRLPVVVYATQETLRELSTMATPIRDVAITEPGAADFRVSMTLNNENLTGIAVDNLRLSAPLVRTPARERRQQGSDIASFNVLRAGPTDGFCLTVFTDVDSGTLGDPGELTPVSLLDCDRASRWRYDAETRQIIAQATGFNGESFCLTATDRNFLNVDGTAFRAPSDMWISGCRNGPEFDRFGRPILYSEGSQPSRQHFEFDEQRIRMVTHPAYLTIGNPNSNSLVPRRLDLTYELSAAPDFFNQANGLAISEDGNLFSVGKQFGPRTWGAEGIAEVELAFGGESYVSYLPVIGVSAEGNASFSANLFTKEVSLIDVSFALKRHLSKRLSITGRSYPDKVVENGAMLKVDIVGKEVVQRGSLDQITVSEAYTDELVSDVLNDAQLPDFDLAYAPPIHKMDYPFPEGRVPVGPLTVTVGGGVKGDVDLNFGLSTPAIGIDLNTSQGFTLSGYGEAKLDAIIAAAGIEGEVKLINQRLEFTASGEFDSAQQDPSSLAFRSDAAMDNRLQLVMASLHGFAEAVSGACFFSCGFPPKLTYSRKRYTLFESDWLFNSDANVFSRNIEETIIDY